MKEPLLIIFFEKIHWHVDL